MHPRGNPKKNSMLCSLTILRWIIDSEPDGHFDYDRILPDLLPVDVAVTSSPLSFRPSLTFSNNDISSPVFHLLLCMVHPQWRGNLFPGQSTSFPYLLAFFPLCLLRWMVEFLSHLRSGRVSSSKSTLTYPLLVLQAQSLSRTSFYHCQLRGCHSAICTGTFKSSPSFPCLPFLLPTL